MIWLKRLGLSALASAAFVVLFVLAGYLLPSEVSLTTERTVAVPPERVYALVSTSEGVRDWWAPISDKAVEDGYPRMSIIPDGMHKVRFESGDWVMERWTLTRAANDGSEVVWNVDFGMLVVERTLTLAPEGDGTHITWSETGTMGNPLMRWFALFSDPTENFQHAMAGLESAR